MDKIELREYLIDIIVKKLYEEGRAVDESSVIYRIAKQEYQNNGGEARTWNVFYDSLRDDMLSEKNETILIRHGKNLGLTDLGREMGASGGYIKYKAAARMKGILDKTILYTYYLIAMVGTLVTAGFVHFSKTYEVPVPPLWMIFLLLVIVGLASDAIPRVSKLMTRITE